MEQAWLPMYFKYMNSKKYNNLDKDINKIFKLIILFSVFLIYFGSDIGIILADKKYHTSFIIIPIIVIGYIFYGIFVIYNRNILYSKRTIYSSIIAILSGIVNLLLNAIYIPKYGYVAGAYTTLASYFFMAILTWLVVKFLIKLHITPFIIIIKSILLAY